MATDNKPTSTGTEVQGEGDYKAGRRYDQAAREFAESGKVDDAAREAAPDSAQQAAAWEQAEREGASHAKSEKPAAQSGGPKR